MPEDFASAAVRHAIDARLLAQQQRHDNAIYLAGYVAECTLKALMQAAGLSAKPFGHELGQLRLRGLAFLAEAAVEWSRYRPEWGSVLDAWTPELRYEPTTRNRAAAAQEALRDAQGLIDSVIVNMILDGRCSSSTASG